MLTSLPRVGACLNVWSGTQCSRVPSVRRKATGCDNSRYPAPSLTLEPPKGDGVHATFPPTGRPAPGGRRK
ncbi:hypothetical protein Sme01_16410 [Sphaerisporangium melleum]|uniref:Uncharacterized protein n=1 Tax=Sphaerisporangium melleum TaxID=321316 RepID=A0A917RNB1_9ACTN|nr:hypothetical protein GCM10007964_66390 [Sphaerisporangium melleum]GII69165.1 hypothetical protein Sme01_16410 [Sphaerisporangium melleum]